ncbi:GntR family transcriptional regulator [Mesorhizobium sp. 1B3]|uniref:GntR family transcriptional regulator n=1 Tax=Mesorhizobium sp. 1B3 TaxID=3243599 RepID=UPI003D998E40
MTPITADQLSQHAFHTLRTDIIAGKLAPEMRLRIAVLKDLYGIGTSPLREALSRLVADGLVIDLERRGFMVAPISIQDFQDLTNTRKFLEKEALRQSILHGNDDWEGRIISSFHQLTKAQGRLDKAAPETVMEWETLNKAFHETLISACPSKWLLRFRDMVYSYTERYRRICLTTVDVSRNVQNEHKALLDAVLARDFERSATLNDEHLENTFQKVMKSGKLT